MTNPTQTHQQQARSSTDGRASDTPPRGASDSLLVRPRAMPKKTASKKHDELKARPPPLRGDAAKASIDALHREAEQRHALLQQAKKGAAKRENDKAAKVVKESKEAKRQALQERKEQLANDLAEHAERHESQISRIAAKGSAEAEKVREAVDALKESQADALAMDARAQDESMQAAAARRAAKLDDVRSRASKESSKVAKELWLPVPPPGGVSTPARQPTAAASDDGSSPGTVGHHPKHQMRMLRLQQMSPEPTQAQNPINAAAAASTAGMLLQLMRGGAPNAEVLLAKTVEDYLALGAKYGIPLQPPGGVAATVLH